MIDYEMIKKDIKHVNKMDRIGFWLCFIFSLLISFFLQMENWWTLPLFVILLQICNYLMILKNELYIIQNQLLSITNKNKL